jgi:ATP-dependent Clp protease protease subunit
MKHKQSFFQASAQTDGVLEMLIYEDIGMGSDVTAFNIKQQMDKAGVFNSIRLRINSAGGDAFEGIAIGNLIKAQGKPVHVCIDGLAASSASIIAMCGDSIEMSPNAMLMIHNAWAVGVGNGDELRKMADTLDKVSASIAQSYAGKTGKSLDDIKTMMSEETWMSADDALQNHFATSITEEDDKSAVMYAKASVAKSKYFKNVPATFAAANADCSCDCTECVAGDCPECISVECDDPNCQDCPNQMDAEASAETAIEASNLSLFEARLRLVHLHKN